jgi:hypothetical protein
MGLDVGHGDVGCGGRGGGGGRRAGYRAGGEERDGRDDDGAGGTPGNGELHVGGSGFLVGKRCLMVFLRLTFRQERNPVRVVRIADPGHRGE